MSFAKRLVAWQKKYGRHHLPWQVHDAYRVWLSEIMLQQTQVSTVLPYFERFTTRFPNVSALAQAEIDEVLAYWSGLGYYRRAHHLHQAAKQVMTDFGGTFPTKRFELEQLQGVGRSTAAAIAVFAFNEREAILDGNVKRVLARHAGLYGAPNASQTLKALWAKAEERLPQEDLRAYTQGLMDLGSAICTRSKPQCWQCPVSEDCYAHQNNKTHLLPEKASQAKVREHQVVWLLMRCEKRFALWQRGKRGIWGGLWSLPEYQHLAEAKVEQSALLALPAVTHRLTHRLIRAEVWAVSLEEASADYAWFTREEALALGLPTPMREILERWAV
ncbi:MAG: A/G-specific adenine glycosylase [Cardiobacteriaceae bacterium]|nr:A/G-specific adenine glycosylase [Cardiobacteriaceae bacterium]